MKLFHSARVFVAACLLAAVGAQAATFEGTIKYHNDVAYVGFNLEEDSRLKLWTDSFDSAANFDPVIALWSPIVGDLQLVAQNDDNSHVGPGQTYYDSGLSLPTLQAGFYIVTVAAYNNFANGNLLSDGFLHDHSNPIPIENWWTEGSGYWRLNITTVPEPQTYALLLAGLGVMGMLARRRRA